MWQSPGASGVQGKLEQGNWSQPCRMDGAGILEFLPCSWMGQSLAWLLNPAPKSAFYWGERAGLGSSAALSASGHARLGKQSQGNSRVLFLQDNLRSFQLLLHLGVLPLCVSEWEFSSDPQNNQDQALKPLSSVYFFINPPQISVFPQSYRTETFETNCRILEVFERDQDLRSRSFRAGHVGCWALFWAAEVSVDKKRHKKWLKLLKSDTLGITKLRVPKQISHDEQEGQ